MPETPCCAKPEAFIMGPLKESLLGMANPSLVTSEGKQPLFLTSDHTPLHGERGPEVGGRNRRPGCPQQRRGAQGLTDQHRGLCLFPNTLPASFPKRSEARLTGTQPNLHRWGDGLLYSLLETLLVNKYIIYVCESGSTCTLFEDKHGTG